MASSLPPVKNAAFTFPMSLVSQADTDIFKTSVTLAAGDVKVSLDFGAFNNVSTLPTEIGTSGVLSCPLSAAEMNADVVTVKFTDAAGAEWQDALVTIYTAAQTLDTTDSVVDGISAVKPAYTPAVAATGETSANVTLWNGDAPADLDASGNVSAKLADAVTHGGSTASLLLTKATIAATGNDTALTLTGSGTGRGVYVAGGATGNGLHVQGGATAGNAVYIYSSNAHGVYIRAGRVGLNLSGNELDDGSSAIDIYNQGWTNADTIRIDNGVALGSALQIRGYGAEPAVKIQALGTGSGVEITASDGDGLVVAAVGVGHYDINADIHGAAGLTAQEAADAVNNLAPASTGATGSIRAKLDAIKLITDAIDASAVTVTSSNDAGVLTFTQGSTFAATVSGLTISATWAKLYFTLKESDYDPDDLALLQLVETNPGAGTDGLLYLAGDAIASPITVADGTLTVSQAAGTVAIAITDNATALLSKASGLVWDIKTKDAAGATVQNTTGTATITRAVTQTI